MGNRAPTVGRGLLRTGALVLLLTAVGVARWWPWVASDVPLFDEKIYQEAVESIEAGGSPYEATGFLYPPPFAAALSALQSHLGWRSALRGIRVLNLLGYCTLVWVGLARTRWSLRVRLAVGVLLVTLSPLIANAVHVGNLSPLFAGVAVLALATAIQAPTLGGILLGLSIAGKPMAVPALAAVGVARPRRPTAAVVALAVAGLVLLVGIDQLPDLLRRAGGIPDSVYNTSLHRIVHCLRLKVGAVWILLGATVLTGIVVHRSQNHDDSALLVGSAFSLLAIPVLGPHSYVLAYPAFLAALDRWFAQPKPRSSPVALALVVAIGSVHLVHEAPGMEGWPAPLVGLVLLVPLLAAPCLAWWVVRTPRDDGVRPPASVVQPGSSGRTATAAPPG